MPLSEHEQRLLEQMERALYAEDPKFATALRTNTSGKGSRSRAALGVLAFLAGVGLLMTGAITTVVALGVIGFVVMLVGAVMTYSALRGGGAAPAAASEGSAPTPQKGAPKRQRQGGGFMGNMEDRWRRRRDEGA
jgi:UPF0716 family protein affecting phage T7 exclusion